MIRQIENAPPEFIVFASSWMRRPDSDPRIFDWWASYQTHYARVGVADVISPAETRYVWGAQSAARYSRTINNGLEVYQRNAGTNAPGIPHNLIQPQL
jgi:hypothetical protein